MFTGQCETVYGIPMPVQQYTLRYTKCGHSYTVMLASISVVPELVEQNFECSKCYTGPYGNVWD